MMIIIHDFRIPEEYLKSLRAALPGNELIPLNMSGLGRCYPTISSHPDIFLFQLDEKTVVYSPDISSSFLSILKDRGVNIMKGL